MVWIDKDFMECEVCDKPSKRRAKVFIKRDELFLCYACVLNLRTKRLYYSEKEQGYRFRGNSRKNGLLRGRISRDHRLPKGKCRDRKS
jgi:hypothetical protein